MGRTQSYSIFSGVYDRYVDGCEFLEGGDYYGQFKDRYWNTFRYIEDCLGRRSNGAHERKPRVLDIGSGQFAILCRHLLDAHSDVADIDTRHTAALKANGIGFMPADLMKDPIVPDEPYDLVVMAEVIEHVPKPPYLVFRNLYSALRPGGHLLITTPNLYRLRNVMRMLTGQRIFDYFLVPEKDRPLGHFLEYAKDQLDWHVREAGFEIRHSSLEQLTLGGASAKARWGRRTLYPLLWARPLWREHIVVVARRPEH